MNGRAIATTLELSRHNEAVIVSELRRREPRTAVEIADAVALSRPNVQKALNDLARRTGQRCLVARSRSVEPVNHRPAALWSLRAEAAHAVGIDVGANTVRVRIDDLSGPAPAVGAQSLHEVAPDLTVEDRLSAVDHAVGDALTRCGLTVDDVRAVTAATPGIVKDGEVVRCDVIRGWEGHVLRSHLLRAFPSSEVHVENDANMAALGEFVLGERPDPGPGAPEGRHRHMVVVSVGRRLAFGVVIDGSVYRGPSGVVGEPAGIRGTRWSVANRWLTDHSDDAAELLGAAATDVDVDGLAAPLGTALAELTYMVDPALIVIGGPARSAGDRFFARITHHMESAFAPSDRQPPLPRPRIARSMVRDAVALGACEHACRSAIESLLRPVDEVGPASPSRHRQQVDVTSDRAAP